VEHSEREHHWLPGNHSAVIERDRWRVITLLPVSGSVSTWRQTRQTVASADRRTLFSLTPGLARWRLGPDPDPDRLFRVVFRIRCPHATIPQATRSYGENRWMPVIEVLAPGSPRQVRADPLCGQVELVPTITSCCAGSAVHRGANLDMDLTSIDLINGRRYNKLPLS